MENRTNIKYPKAKVNPRGIKVHNTAIKKIYLKEIKNPGRFLKKVDLRKVDIKSLPEKWPRSNKPIYFCNLCGKSDGESGRNPLIFADKIICRRCKVKRDSKLKQKINGKKTNIKRKKRV